MSGGKESLGYYASISYNTQEGILTGNEYNRLNASLSLDSKISSKISASLNVNFINMEEFRLLDEQDVGAPLQAIVLPASDSYDPNKNYNLIVRSLEYNPLTEVNFSDNLGLSNSLIASLGIEYDITEGVSFDENGGVDFSDQRNERR